MMGENMWPDSNTGEKPMVEQEQKLEGEIDNQFQELTAGLDSVQASLENLDQDNNTPERTQALKKIWEGYKKIESTVNILLMMYGSTTIGSSVHKIFTHPGDNEGNIASLITGVAALSVAVAGFIREEKNHKAKLEGNA